MLEGPPTLGECLQAAYSDPRTDDELAEEFAANCRQHDGSPLTEPQVFALKTAYLMYLDANDQSSIEDAYLMQGYQPEEVTFTRPDLPWWRLTLWMPDMLAEVLCGPAS